MKWEKATEAAANAISECSGMRFDGFWSRIEDLEPEDREYALTEARAALEAAAPHLLAQIWDEAYRQGVEDERVSEANIGVAGCLCDRNQCACKIEPARSNPYRAEALPCNCDNGEAYGHHIWCDTYRPHGMSQAAWEGHLGRHPLLGDEQRGRFGE